MFISNAFEPFQRLTFLKFTMFVSCIFWITNVAHNLRSRTHWSWFLYTTEHYYIYLILIPFIIFVSKFFSKMEPLTNDPWLWMNGNHGLMPTLPYTTQTLAYVSLLFILEIPHAHTCIYWIFFGIFFLLLSHWLYVRSF